MFKIRKSAVFNAAKISLGCAMSIAIAMLVGLNFSTTTGLITVLSIQNTKKDTLDIAVKRIISFFAALIISFVCFKLIGYTTIGFAVYIFAFILFCGLIDAQSAIVPVSVLITHILAEKNFTLGIVMNEFMILFIGAGIGFALNLYLHRDMKKMLEYRSAVDNEIKAILSRMSDRVLVADKSDYNAECFVRLEGYIRSAKETAVLNRQNTLYNADNYDLLYLEMREKQCVILREMYKAVKEMNTTPEQVKVISGLLKKISEEYHERNNADGLIAENDRIILSMKEHKMPETREEFENRAILYSLLIRTREFLSIKNMFMKSRI